MRSGGLNLTIMATATEPMALIQVEEILFDMLARAEGKAEIVNHRLVVEVMSGTAHSHAALEVAVSLRAYVRGRGLPGRAATDGLDYKVRGGTHQSFRPDASYDVGPGSGMDLPERAPRFAVEVRSASDYGPAADDMLREKREDYFDAGTSVVWDVDLESEAAVVCLFRDGDAETPAAVFRRGELAHAEPAVPGWTMPVDDLFEPEANAG